MISVAKPSSPSTPSERWGDLLALGLVLMVGVGGSLLGYRALRATEQLRLDEQRVEAGQTVMDSFTLELIRTTEAVRSATLMIESHPQLSRKLFNNYAAKVMAGLPSIAYMEWQPVVPHAQLAQFEELARAQGLPDYRVVEPNTQGKGWVSPQSRAEHVPVLYAWPEDTAALGLDLAYDPAKMESKLQARDAGQPMASHAFHVVIANAVTTHSMAFTITGAVVNNDMHGVSSLGYLAAIVPLPALLKQAAARANARKFDLLVYDRGSKSSQAIYSTYGNDSDQGNSPAEMPRDPANDLVMSVDVANRLWEVVLHPRPTFFSSQPQSTAPWVLASGLLVTLSLLLALASIQHGRRKVEAAQATVTEQRQRLQDIIEATDVGTWEVNLATGAIRVNERWAAMGGHTAAGWKPPPDYQWQDDCHPDDLAQAKAALQRHLSGDADHYEAEYRHRHTDGRWIWVAARGKVISWFANGMPLIIAGTLSEISHRKEAEARILELNNTLEQRVEERSAQLEAAMQTLRHSQEELTRSEARATLSTLVASVSHELGSPMGNGMLAASSLTAQAQAFQQTLDAGTLRRTDLATFVTQVREGSSLTLRNLERAVELLKKFRQVAADQASEQRRSFDLQQTIQEVLDTLAPSLKNKPHRVVLDIAPDIAMDSYPGPLGQVLINLINNAYLHAFEGVAAGQVTIQAHATKEARDSENESDWVELTVRDNGRGIAPDHLAHLFTPFFSTKIGDGGTGLGLSIVNNLVTKILGGRVSIESELGRGTLFTMNLPRVAPYTPAAERI